MCRSACIAAIILTSFLAGARASGQVHQVSPKPTGQGVSSVTSSDQLSPNHQADSVAGSDPKGDYKFEAGDGTLRIPVEWKGKIGCFGVDTGASTSVVDAREFSGLPSEGEAEVVLPESDNLKCSLCRPPEILVGRFQLAHCGPALRIDRSGILNKNGSRYLGLLGMSAMDCMALQVDFERHRFRVLPAFSDSQPEWGANVVPVHFEQHQVPTVQIEIDEQTIDAILDTGMNGEAQLAAGLFDKLSQISTIRKEMVWAGKGPYVEDVPTKTAVVLRLVGGVSYHNVIIKRGGSESRIDYGLLARNRMITIDVAAKRMFVREKDNAKQDHP